MRLRIVEVLILSVSVCPWIFGENKLFINPAEVSPGEKVVVPVLLDNDQPLYGFSLSLATDPSLLKISSPYLDLEETPIADAGWSFGQTAEDGSSISWGVVMDVTAPFDVGKVVPAGQGVHIANVHVEVTATASGTAQIVFQNFPANPTANPPDPGAKNLLVGDQGNSEPFTTSPGTLTILDTSPSFIRGDANSSSKVDLSDAVFILNFLFLGGPAPLCRDSADADDKGDVNLTDAIYILAFLFQGGPAIPEPYPDPGPDTTEDSISCEG